MLQAPQILPAVLAQHLDKKDHQGCTPLHVAINKGIMSVSHLRDLMAW